MQAPSNIEYKVLYEQSSQQLQEARQIIAEQNKVIDVLRGQIDQLHAHIAVQNQLIASQGQTIIDQQKQLEHLPVLEHELQQLKRMIYGKKSERFIGHTTNHKPANGQLSLDMQAEQVDVCSLTQAQKITYTRAPKLGKPHPSRQVLCEQLPKKITLLTPEGVPPDAVQIGVEKTRSLHYKAPELWIDELHRPVFLVLTNAEEQTSKMLIAPLPAQPIDKCMAGASLLAHLVVEKYVYHLPVYRQQQRLQALGVKLSYSTLVDWVNRVADLLLSLYLALSKEVMDSGYIHGDETPMRVIDGEKPRQHKSHLGYLWGFHNSLHKVVFFIYRPGRAARHIWEILKDYRGYLQTDGYQVYDRFGAQPGVVHLQCMAHARRKFEEALTNDPKRAQYALEHFFAKLYSIERQIEDLGFEERKQQRQHKAVPVLRAFKEWLTAQLADVLPKSPIGKAIAYCLNRVEQLCIYTENGMLSIDNNAIERNIRPISVGKKNYLFCGSHAAAQRTAIIYSLLGTCKLHGIDPYEWLHDVLQQLPTCKHKNIKELLPQYWKPSQGVTSPAN